MKQMKTNGLLLLTALIWGCAFVAQSVGMDYVGPFTFNAVRYWIGAAVLLPVIWLRKDRPHTQDKKILLKGGILCGIALGVASSLQQWGILFTSVGKAGFITAMYIVLVPLVGIFIGKKVRPLLWFCVALAAAGLYFLCMHGVYRLNIGDVLLMLCALVFTGHILLIDHFSPMVDGIKLSAMQFFVAGIVCGIPMLILERPGMGELLSAWMPILYAGVLSSGVGYTLQVVAQKDADPTVASLLLSLESVFSVLAGWVLLGQGLSVRELFGCVLMFGAIILAQLPERNAGA